MDPTRSETQQTKTTIASRENGLRLEHEGRVFITGLQRSGFPIRPDKYTWRLKPKGTTPCNLLPETLNWLSLKFVNFTGISPFKELTARSRYVKSGKFPSFGGIEPVKRQVQLCHVSPESHVTGNFAGKHVILKSKFL